ncbi:MAG: hypothetical protein ACQETE_14475 [Bacteroidota bacterium]
MIIAAYLFCFLILLTVLFQFALAFGAPWGHLAMGGKYPGKFPLRMRIGAVIQSLVLSLLAVIVLTRAGTILPSYTQLSEMLIWIVVGISTLSLILNVITPSKWERILWAPVALMMLVSSLIVALS